MLDLIRDYQALIAGAFGFGAVILTIWSAKKNIMARIQSDRDRDAHQRKTLQASAYEYYINASEKLVTRSAFSIVAIGAYTVSLKDKGASRTHFSDELGMLQQNIKRLNHRPPLIDSDLITFYTLLDPISRRSVAEFESVSNYIDAIEFMIFDDIDPILNSEGDDWGDDEREYILECIEMLVNFYCDRAVFAAGCYARTLNHFLYELEHPDPVPEENNMHEHLRSVVAVLEKAVESVLETWNSDSVRDCVAYVRKISQHVETGLEAQPRRRGLLKGKAHRPERIPEVPDAILMAASERMSRAGARQASGGLG